MSNYLPDQFLVRELDNIDCTFLSSDYRRSTDSVNLLSKLDSNFSDMLYREFDLPSGRGTFIELNPNWWATFFRVSWLVGYTGRIESFSLALVRVEEARQHI